MRRAVARQRRCDRGGQPPIVYRSYRETVTTIGIRSTARTCSAPTVLQKGNNNYPKK